ncbi:hypothetical protein [Laribacter hongkongensis]|uniref:hypothetical protein n=1 Tax=Laribacter hongkongensis TaxID=168471 RepID=UPI001EFCFDA0|nr:hypothetical protein [Laribacter hongkongensis]MCG9081245.1 hypothetical protein [Laribacter hongkongensis]
MGTKAAATYETEFAIGEPVTIKATGRSGIVTGIFIQEASQTLFRTEYPDESGAIHETYLPASRLDAGNNQ